MFRFRLRDGKKYSWPSFVGLVAFLVCGMFKSSQFGLYYSVLLFGSLVGSFVSNSRNSVE